MSSFETIGVTVKEDFVRVGWIWVLFLLEFALGQMVRSGVMDTSVVGLGLGGGGGGGRLCGRQREGSERWCPMAAIRTAMPPAAAMATWLLSVSHARFTKAKQACSRATALSGCGFMTSSMTCRGKGGVGVSIWCVCGVQIGGVGVRGKVRMTVRC